MNPRLLRVLAISYAIKTLLLGVAWIFVPGLPQRVANRMRATFSSSQTP